MKFATPEDRVTVVIESLSDEIAELRFDVAEMRCRTRQSVRGSVRREAAAPVDDRRGSGSSGGG